MYPSWFKLETKTLSSQLRRLPFDLMYLIPESDRSLFSQVYDVFLEVTPSQEMLESIRTLRVEKLNEVGITRKYTRTKTVLSVASVGDYLPADLQDIILCIPSLPRKKAGKVRISYMISREAVNKLDKKREAGSFPEDCKTPIDQILCDMTLHHLNKESPPCVICTNSLQKAADPKHCTLGTSTCLEKICLRNVEAFDDKIRQVAQ